VTSVQAHGRIVRAWLGVRFLSVDEELAKQNHLAYSYGALVLGGERDQDVAVVKGSPADKAGLVENDLILEVNGTKLEGAQTLSSFIERCLPGDVLHLKIVEKGKEKMVDVTLDERPSRE
jgi:serine protease Do